MLVPIYSLFLLVLPAVLGGTAMADSSCPEKGAPILIVGAGTWGTSIAYRLAKRGYTNIVVLDSNDFPSSLAAGNDHNKILEERMFTLPLLYPTNSD